MLITLEYVSNSLPLFYLFIYHFIILTLTKAQGMQQQTDAVHGIYITLVYNVCIFLQLTK